MGDNDNKSNIPADLSKFLNENGEINAHSTDELAEIIKEMGETVSDVQSDIEADKAHKEEMGTMFVSAIQDVDSFVSLGETIADTVNMTVRRDGFTRRLLGHQSLVKGQFPRAKAVNKESTVAIDPHNVITTDLDELRGCIYPPEFYLTAQIPVDIEGLKKEFEISGENPLIFSDILDEIYNRALAITMVAEDNIWKAMVDSLKPEKLGLMAKLLRFLRIRKVESDKFNPRLEIKGNNFKPEHLYNMLKVLAKWNLSPKHILVGSAVWNSITFSSEWSSLIDPVSKWDILKTGKMGTIFGTDILSDHFRHTNHKILDAGDVYCVSEPESHGQYTDRGGYKSHSIIPTSSDSMRGWNFIVLLSMAVTDYHSVVHSHLKT